MSDAQNHAPGDDAEDLGDDKTVAPSQTNDVDEQSKAPSGDDPDADHEATGIGVIGEE